MNAHIHIPRSQIDSFCHRWLVSELSLFGSVVREDFGPDSDVDVLIQFQPQARHTLLDMARMEEELRQIFGRDVDLVERSAVEQSRNISVARRFCNRRSQSMPRNDAAYLLEMLLAAQDAARFATGLTFSQFEKSRLHQYAILKAI